MPLRFKLDDKEFTLSNKCLLAMKSLLDKTRAKERGLGLCQDTEVTPGKESIGGRYSIATRNCTIVKDEVITKRPQIGFYHTHPTGDSGPSWYDAYSIINRSLRRGRPDLGCRGSRQDGMVRCDTIKHLPAERALDQLRARRPKMKLTDAEADPEIWQYFATPFAFPASQVPEIVEPTRIREEHFVGVEGRKFIRYFDTLTRRRWTVEVK